MWLIIDGNKYSVTGQLLDLLVMGKLHQLQWRFVTYGKSY